MATKLYWINGPWPGKLAVSSRPRGGDWLGDEIGSWQRAGIARVVSLLTAEEERDLDLANEADEVRARGMKFISLPIPDRGVPNSQSEVTAVLEKLDADLASGSGAVIHCRQGIGRSGLLAVCLLVSKGLDPQKAVEVVGFARGVDVPETEEQRGWIDHYAAVLASPK
jgi:protein-tyrosine phosphatase